MGIPHSISALPDVYKRQIRGYEVGAVDYITKPFVIGALQRKIKAMFAMLEHHKPAKDIYDDGRLFLDFSEQTASLNGKPLDVYKRQGYSNVNDYSKYLQGKYHYMNIGLTSMQGIPTTVSVSSAFLQKCMNDPEKAKYLEENLAAIPDCTKDTINGCLGTVTNQSYMIDANGNIIETASCTNDPDGKIAKENAERKAKENREKEEKVKEKRAAKKAEEEKAAKKRAEKSAERKETGDYTLSVTGTDVKSMTQSLVAGSVSISVPDRSSFDIKA